MNRSGISATVSSPRDGCSPRRAKSVGGQGSPAPIEPAQRILDPVVQHAWRERPVAPDEPDPDRVCRDPAERHRVGRAVQHALDLALPVLRHLGEVGEDLARPPARLIRIVVDGGHRPGCAGLHRRTGRGQPAACRLEPVEQVVHVASVARRA